MDPIVREKCVVLLSGGLDSVAGLFLSRQKYQPILALTFNYGQKSYEREILAATHYASLFGVKHKVVDLSFLGKLGGNALTAIELNVPSVLTESLDDKALSEKSAKAVWVYNRNGIFINVGAAYAEALGANTLVCGFNREEARTFPDNSAEFLRAASQALAYSTSNQVKVESLSETLNKIETVQAVKAIDPLFDFSRIWSCYEGGTVPCKKCESCKRYERAINQ